MFSFLSLHLLSFISTSYKLKTVRLRIKVVFCWWKREKCLSLQSQSKERKDKRMKELLLILVITAILIVVCVLLLGIKIFFKKNGKFPHTCAFDWQENKCKDCDGNCKDCTINIGKIDVNKS